MFTWFDFTVRFDEEIKFCETELCKTEQAMLKWYTLACKKGLFFFSALRRSLDCYLTEEMNEELKCIVRKFIKLHHHQVKLHVAASQEQQEKKHYEILYKQGDIQ